MRPKIRLRQTGEKVALVAILTEEACTSLLETRSKTQTSKEHIKDTYCTSLLVLWHAKCNRSDAAHFLLQIFVLFAR